MAQPPDNEEEEERPLTSSALKFPEPSLYTPLTGRLDTCWLGPAVEPSNCRPQPRLDVIRSVKDIGPSSVRVLDIHGSGDKYPVHHPLLQDNPEWFWCEVARVLRIQPKELYNRVLLIQLTNCEHAAVWLHELVVVVRRATVLRVCLRQDFRFADLCGQAVRDRWNACAGMQLVTAIRTSSSPLTQIDVWQHQLAGLSERNGVLRLSYARFAHPWTMVLPVLDMCGTGASSTVLQFECLPANSLEPALSVGTQLHEMPLTQASPLHHQRGVMLIVKQLFERRNETQSTLNMAVHTHTESPLYTDSLRDRIALLDATCALIRRDYVAGGGRWFDETVFKPSLSASSGPLVVGSTQWTECWQQIMDTMMDTDVPVPTEKRKQSVVGSLTADDIELNCALELSLLESKRAKPDEPPAAAAAVTDANDDDLLFDFCADSYQSDADEEPTD